jgi:hypothetical protein
MRRRAVSFIGAAGLALAASVTLVSTGGPAAAGTAPQATKELDLAGYHFTVSKATTSLTLKGDIVVPSVSCGSGVYVFAPQVVAHYYVGSNLDTVSAALGLGCTDGIPAFGDPVLLVGSKTVNGTHQVTAGEKVAITITIGKSAASVRLVYSSTLSDSGQGGRPHDGQYSVALPTPPRYGPVKFSGCTVNGKSLASRGPGAWEGVNKSGKVTGVPSKISGGTGFTVTS